MMKNKSKLCCCYMYTSVYLKMANVISKKKNIGGTQYTHII